MNRLLGVGVVLCTVLLGACGGPAIPPTVRDSAGVTIVENHEPQWGRGHRWSLSGPRLRLGSGGPGSRPLDGATSSVRLSDGRFVVANGGTQELLWYDAAGDLVHRAGGRGRGPAQFTGLEWVGLLADETILAYDFQALRFTIFADDGTLRAASDMVLAGDLTGGAVRGVFADSTVLVVGDVRTWVPPLLRPGSRTRGLVRGPANGFRYGLDGSLIGTYGTFEGSERILAGVRIVRADMRPFGRDAVFAVGPDRFYVGTQNRYEVDVFDVNGTTIASVRRGQLNTPVTEEHIDLYKARRLAGITGLRELGERERELDALPFPDAMPAYTSIHVDDVGNLWVAEYQYPAEESVEWTVFDGAYRMLGNVRLPGALEVHQIGDDYVLGRWRTPSAAEEIRLYDLMKPQP